LCFVVTGLSGIYIDSLQILQYGEDFSFYTYQTDELIVSIYKIDDGYTSYGYLQKNERPIYRDKDMITSYKITPSENWSKEIIPSYFFENIGSYLLKIEYDYKTVYSVIERTNIDGVAMVDENTVYLKIWNTFTGKNVNFGKIYSDINNETLIGSISDNGFYSGDKDKLTDKMLFIKTPEGNCFIYLDSPDKAYYSVENILLFDKPMYKPGEEINARTFFYNKKTGNFIREGVLKYKIYDPLGREKSSGEYSLDNSGGANINYKTDEEQKRGHYQIEFNLETESEQHYFYKYFELADYQKPPFSVEISNLKKIYSRGENVQFDIKADYYYGQGISEGNAHITFEKLPLDVYGYYYNGGEVVDIRTTKIENGIGSFKYSLKENERAKYKVDVNVVDKSGREVSEAKYFTYIPSDMDIKIENIKRWINKGSEFSFEILTEIISDDSKDINREIKVIIKDYDNNEVLNQTLNVIVNERTKFDKIIEKPGYYKYELIDLKYPENKIIDSFFVYSSDYKYSTDNEIEIIPNKAEFSPGDIIHLNVLSSYKNFNLLLLIDFGNRFIYKDLYMESGNSEFSFEIPKSINVNKINVEIISYYGGKEIREYESYKVNLRNRTLNLSIDSPEKIKPGESAEIELITENSSEDIFGCLSVVDQSLLDLYGTDDWEGIADGLNNPVDSYRVYGFNNPYYFSKAFAYIEDSLYETPETLAQTKAAANGKSARVRSEFSDIAMWIPVIRLNGKTIVDVDFPEDLTTWKVRLFANTMSGKTGYASKNIISTLPVTTSAVFPKFLTEEDEIMLGVNTGNYSGADSEFKVSLESAGVELSVNEEINNGTNKITWFEFKVPNIENATEISLKISSESETGSDSMIVTLPLKKRIYSEDHGNSGILGIQGKMFEFIAKTDTEMKITLSSNMKSELLDSIEYLIKYPYGCTEQTISSFLPALAFLSLNPLDGEEIRNKIEDITKKALSKIYSYQHYDGGWGWWKNDDSHPFMTAYVMYTFSILRNMDIPFNESVFQYGLQALKNLVSETEGEYIPFCNYVIRRIESDYPVMFKEQNLTSKLFFGLSLAENENPLAETILQQLLEEGIRWNEFFRISFNSDSYFLNDLQLNSLLLMFMNELDYNGEEKYLLINYLFRNRNGSYWYSTKDTAFVVMALSPVANSNKDYEVFLKGNLSEFDGGLQDTKIRLDESSVVSSTIHLNEGDRISLGLSGTEGLIWKFVWNEKWKYDEYKPDKESILKRNIEKKTNLEIVASDETSFIRSIYIPYKNKIAPYMLVSADAEMENESKPLNSFYFKVYNVNDEKYYSLYVNGEYSGLTFYNEIRITGFDGNSILISRNPFTGEEGSWKLLFKENDSSVRIGDVIRISNTVNIDKKMNYAAFDEEIPSCFVQSEDDELYQYDKFLLTSNDRLWWYTSNSEDRFDRSLLFYNSIPKGDYVVNNYYKITSSGKFVIPPSKLFEMYDYESVYTSAPISIEVK